MTHILPTTTRQQVTPDTFPEAVECVLVFGAAALAVAVAPIIALGVIPDVKEFWLPNSTGSEGAVPAFWASIVANLVFAAVLTAVALRHGLRRSGRRRLVGVLAVGALVQALMYLDAVAAFRGPVEDLLQPATVRLRFAVAADALAGVLALIAVTAAMLRARREDCAARRWGPHATQV